ncbi:deoxynucleoside kinase [Chloroherpeton thalassium ATCC 35110]|uniref:Deoxynucleoside kinase n=1 Tax=Chloroherpeton thalassium (strain ATCC 35110 / GB-78) TaxID=517418 RepID=B3QUM8_CHLT3|nr:deoxynucleoside kinase [Chloroherpeton thalassium]ACF12934.1 deoxynucleoside kinase [Chloroherpeton thalassium ATCC 35110]
MSFEARRLKYIAIEGVIGVGKTSLAKKLSEKCGHRLLLEEFEENPFLASFYQNPQCFALPAQLFFLLRRYKQQHQISEISLAANGLISDYSFQKNDIFAKTTLNKEEFSLYSAYAEILQANIPKPDLVVYLQSTPERLIKNIHQRARRYEHCIESPYIKKLHAAYNEFFFAFASSNQCVIDVSQLDFVENPRDFERLYRIIFCGDMNDKLVIKKPE